MLIPPKNLSLTGAALREAKKERQYLWELLTREQTLPVSLIDDPTEEEEKV
jgi:hypothetical protein